MGYSLDNFWIGISLLGVIASIAGGFLIGLVAFLSLALQCNMQGSYDIIGIGLAAGLFGSMVESNTWWTCIVNNRNRLIHFSVQLYKKLNSTNKGILLSLNLLGITRETCCTLAALTYSAITKSTLFHHY